MPNMRSTPTFWTESNVEGGLANKPTDLFGSDKYPNGNVIAYEQEDDAPRPNNADVHNGHWQSSGNS